MLMNPILGIHDGHNAAAAILHQGKIIAAVQEERLTGNKNQGGLPRQAIGDVLSMSGMSRSEIGKVALNGHYMTYDHWDREALLEEYERCGGTVAQLKQPLKGTFVDDLYQKRHACERTRQLF
jgi:predicted NodU family carbamoyl transferase